MKAWTIFSKCRWDRNALIFVNRLSRKKLLYTTELIWESSLKSLSILKPRFKTDYLTCRAKRPKFTLDGSQESLGPNTILSVIWSLKLKKLRAIGFLMSCRQDRSGLIEEQFLLMGTHNWLSSAFQWNETPCFLIRNSSGRRYNDKEEVLKLSSGESHRPRSCGWCNQETLTIIVLSARYDLNQ